MNRVVTALAAQMTGERVNNARLLPAPTLTEILDQATEDLAVLRVSNEHARARTLQREYGGTLEQWL